MDPADRVLAGLAAGTPLSPTVALLARAGREEAWGLRLALALCLLAGAVQQAGMLLLPLWPNPTVFGLACAGLLLSTVHVFGARLAAVPFGAMGLAQALGFDHWPLALLPFPIACATALLARHLDREIAAKEAGGGPLAEPPSA